MIRCPRCGEDEDLRGVEEDGVRLIRCGRCEHRWERDLTPTCTVCGSEQLEAVPTSTLEEAGRGDQRTPSGIRDLYRCWSCGARDATSGDAVADREWLDRRRGEIARQSSSRGASPADRSTGRRHASRFGTFEVGAVVGGRWRVTRLLDWSDSASRWAATDLEGKRRVMFAVLHRSETTDADRRGVYVGSARAARLVEHEHLLRILDVRVQPPDVMVVAAFRGNRTLADAIAGPPIPPQRLEEIGVAIAAGLAAMHSRGLSHLHVRPTDVAVPEGGPAALIDLGVGRARARVRAAQTSDPDLRWMAPEQLLSHEHGKPADVYSLALSLWAAAGGDLTVLGASSAAQASTRFERDLPDLAEVLADPVPSLRAACLAGGRRDPEHRPSAAELLSVLRDDPAA